MRPLVASVVIALSLSREAPAADDALKSFQDSVSAANAKLTASLDAAKKSAPYRSYWYPEGAAKSEVSSIMLYLDHYTAVPSFLWVPMNGNNTAGTFEVNHDPKLNEDVILMRAGEQKFKIFNVVSVDDSKMVVRLPNGEKQTWERGNRMK